MTEEKNKIAVQCCKRLELLLHDQIQEDFERLKKSDEKMFEMLTELELRNPGIINVLELIWRKAYVIGVVRCGEIMS